MPEPQWPGAGALFGRGMILMKATLRAEHELVPLGGDASFAVREFKLPRFTSPWHLHAEYELAWIVRGTGKRFVGDSVAGFSNGDLVLVGSNLPHYWCSDPAVKTGSHSVVVQFRDDCLGEGFFDRPEMKAVKALLRRSRRGIEFSGATRKKVTERMMSLPRSSGLRRIQGFLAILDLLSTSKTAGVLASVGFLSTVDGFQDQRIGKACRYIFGNLAEEIRLADVAKVVGMNPEAFCRLFRRMTGQTLFSFINRARVGHACALLMESDLNVTEASYASGFHSLSNFNQRFREIKGMSPRQFRKQFS